METNYWSRESRRWSRREVIRGAGLAGIGIGAAALVGCSDDEETPSTGTPAPGGGTATPSATAGGGGGNGGSGNIPEGALVPRVEGAPTQGGSFITGWTATGSQHDMHTALGLTVWHGISERAFELDSWTAELKGEAVESWEVADDQGLELIMHVRPGLVMHDKEPWNGREFNAEDLAFNLERNAGLYAEAEGIPRTSFQRRSMVEGLQSAEAVDERTVRIQMARPNGALFNGMAEIRTQLMPKEIVDVGFEDPTKFASFGAYTLSDFRPGEREVYTRHPNYYQSDQAHFDQMERVVIADRASTVAAFIDGQTSAFWGPLPHERDAIKAANGDALYYEWTDSNWDHFRWNTATPALADARVRKAFALAIDRAAINDAYYGPGWSWAAVTHPDYQEGWSREKTLTVPGYNPDTKDEDRAEAARLLEAAGYADGAGIDLVLIPQIGGTFEEHALRFIDQMSGLFPDINIEIERPSDGTAFATRQAARDFDSIAYVITVVPDVFLELHSQYHTDGSRNYGSFSEPQADELISRGLQSLTIDERVEIADEFQTRFVEDWHANLILNIRPERYFLQGNIGGFDHAAGPWAFTVYRVMNDAKHWYYV